ncbi:hypothetical protein [Roseivirga thermotolerans]|uniref:hypothetical protein n=1 Tax=Roseivirga thermotolerans TaxID=1758176 RepID=UPI00273D0F9A|nr:hypothetical protein [Roseivirga thermotolerans]
MDIFCEFIDDDFYLSVNQSVLKLKIPLSFYEQAEDAERNDFFSKIYEFNKKYGNQKFFRRNKVFIRTDKRNERDILKIFDFSISVLEAVKTKIYTSDSISRLELLNKSFLHGIDLILKIRNDYKAKNRISKEEKKSRQKTQGIGLLITFCLTFVLSFICPLDSPPEPQLKYSLIYWLLFFSIIFFFGWVQYSIMKIPFKTTFNSFFGTVVAVLLLSRFGLKPILNFASLDNSFQWIELAVQGGFYFIWNEKIAVYFNTRNDQLNK